MKFIPFFNTAKYDKISLLLKIQKWLLINPLLAADFLLLEQLEEAG